MINIKYTTIPLTKENIKLLEQIRYNAYQINISPINNNYTIQLKNNQYIVFGCFLNEKLVGACYISNSYKSLYIEQLFILKEYQKSNHKLGSNLLRFILKNKKIIEKYYNSKFNISYLDSTKELTTFYQSLGYKESNFLMRKRI